MMKTYLEKLKDPRWQKKRLEILERDGWRCVVCQDSETTLHVHHMGYIPGYNPWDYENEDLVTLCELCHEMERTTRPDYEKLLLETLRARFFSDDLFKIVEGFSNLKMFVGSEVMARILKYVLSDTNKMKEVLDRFIENKKAV